MLNEREDKLKPRYEIIDQLIKIIPYGKAVIHWQERVVVKIEEINPKESIITR